MSLLCKFGGIGVMNKWTSVKDILPDDKKEPIVLICAHNKTHSWVQLGRYLEEFGGWHLVDQCLDDVEPDFDEEITHWMELPEAPNE